MQANNIIDKVPGPLESRNPRLFRLFGSLRPWFQYESTRSNETETGKPDQCSCSAAILGDKGVLFARESLLKSSDLSRVTDLSQFLDCRDGRSSGQKS